MKRETLILDSSQISIWYECPQMWNLSYQENLTSANIIDDPISAGTYGHKLLENYYKAFANGINPNDALENALKWEIPQSFPLGDKKIQLVRTRVKDYWFTHVHNDFTPLMGKPKHSIQFDDSGNIIDCYNPEPLVERGFTYPLYVSKEYLFALEGKIDLIARDQSGNVVWVDHKFQFRERTLYHKSIQFRNYALATGMNLGIINYIGLQQTISDKTFRRQPIQFQPNELKEWKEELIEKFISIVKERKNKHFFASNKSRNRDSCSGKFGYPCEFTKICEESNPLVQIGIKNQYQKKEIWRPW